MIKAQHGGEVFRRQARGRLHRDVGICVGRIANYQHFDIARGNRIQRFALYRKDLRIRFQQILALHTRAAWTCTHQQRNISVFEGGHRVSVCSHAGEQRECTVVYFHHHAFQRFLCFLVRDLQQLKNNGLVLAEHVAIGDAEQQGIADLTCGASNGYSHGSF